MRGRANGKNIIFISGRGLVFWTAIVMPCDKINAVCGGRGLRKRGAWHSILETTNESNRVI